MLDSVGLRERSCAIAPATIGVAIEVPVKESEAVSLSAIVERTATPGATMSTQSP